MTQHVTIQLDDLLDRLSNGGLTAADEAAKWKQVFEPSSLWDLCKSKPAKIGLPLAFLFLAASLLGYLSGDNITPEHSKEIIGWLITKLTKC